MENVCRIVDFRNKEVINLYSGMRLGYIHDIEFDIITGKVISIVLQGGLKFLGLFGRYDDIIIPWEKIDKIGDDIIIVNFEFIANFEIKPRKNWFNI